jgi:ubiquinone/menaquinone biosynthesis C-methylase UbiE
LRRALARAAQPGGSRGDAEALPLPDASVDVALSQRSLCTFPDKPHRLEARLRAARMLAPPGDQHERIREAAALARMAIDAIARGTLGYALIPARV